MSDEESKIYLKDLDEDGKLRNPLGWILLLLLPFVIAMYISFVRGDKTPASYAVPEAQQQQSTDGR